ncbi:MAG TPA: efflux RND transporter periplasmic adaptor subunit [Fibrobacteres bacterium]|nr:efflux RND transporter periplasmic adaptor subunit [Fibrobacterota bacterium]
MKKSIWWSIIVVAILAGAGTWWWSHREAEIKWRKAAVERGSIQVSVTATGTLQAVTTVAVGTQVSGIISALYADFNSQVKKGQIIARIDTTLLATALADARSNLAKAEAQHYQAQAELKRAQPLFDKGLISQAELDQADASAKMATATLESAKAGLERAKINLHYALIVSPIDGIVLSRAVDIGQTVAASFNTPTLFSIAGDLRKMQVLASVDEADIGQLKVGQQASFAVDAYPDAQFSGTVSQIRLQPIVTQNVVTYNAIIDVDNPDLKLMPGMTASLTIAVQSKDDVLLVPSTALRFQPPRKPKSPADSTRGKREGGGGWKRNGGGNKGRIFVLENGKPKPIRVETGLTDGSKTEISGEINEGDSILTGVETPATTNSQSRPFGMQQGMGGPGGGRGMR